MDIKDILSKTDHTLLKQGASWDDIMGIIDDAAEYSAASVCIPPSFVKRAAEYSAGRVSICTVIGFPNGYSTTEAKVFETSDAVRNGANEIDMVINIGMAKEHRWDDVLSEIRAVRAACSGKTLKVIIETGLLDDEEKLELCRVVSASGADFIKTSTGFAGGGATEHDVRLLAENVTNGVLVKASGGIRTLEDAEKFIELGASRLGASAIVAAVKKM